MMARDPWPQHVFLSCCVVGVFRLYGSLVLDAPPTFSKMKSSVKIFWFNVQGHHSHLRLYTLVESQQLARENTASNNPSQFVVVVVIIKTKKQV